jgi:hypothetical protein
VDLVSGVFDVINVFDTFASIMQKFIFKPFRVFEKIMDGLFVIIDFLSFIKVLAEFKVCIAVPKFSWTRCCVDLGFLGTLCIPCPKVSPTTHNTAQKLNDRLTFALFAPQIDWGNKKCADLNDLGNFLGKIEKIIRSIPLVGFIWDLIQEVVQGIIAALFKAIGIELPSFELPLGFVDDVLDDIKDAVNKLDSVIDHFANIIDLDGELFDRIEQVVDDFTDLLPDSFLDITVCDEDIEQCIDDMFGLRIIDGTIPGFALDDVEYTVPEEFVNLVQDVLDRIGDMKEGFEELIDGGIECDEYKTVNINVLEYLEKTYGFETSKLGIPACHTSFQMCTAIVMPGAEPFIEKMTDVLNLADGGSGRRRMSEACSGSEAGGGMAIPLPFPPRLLNMVRRKLMPTNINSKLRQKWENTKTHLAWQNSKLRERVQWAKSKVPALPAAPQSPLSDEWQKRLDFVAGPFYLTKFEFSTNLVIGCANNEFAMKLQIAPFFNVGVHLQSPYILTRLGKAHLINANTYKTSEGGTLASLAEMICHLDYIQATSNAYLGLGYFGTYITVAQETEFKQFVQPFEFHLKLLKKSRKEFISHHLVQQDIEVWKNKLEKAKEETFEPLRFNTQTYYSGSAEAYRVYRGDGSNFWRQAHPEGGDCSGPPSVKDLALGSEDASAVDALWHFMKGLGWHPLEYGK